MTVESSEKRDEEKSQPPEIDKVNLLKVHFLNIFIRKKFSIKMILKEREFDN